MLGTDVFLIGAKVSCSDGECGTLKGVIFVPKSKVLLQIVVLSKADKNARAVPLQQIQSADDTVLLGLTLAEFSKLEFAEESVSVHAPQIPIPVRSSGLLTGVGAAVEHINAERVTNPVTVKRDFVPDNAAEICDGICAHALNGTAGDVVGALFSSDDHLLTHVIVETGHRWSRTNATVPIASVTSFDDGIYFALTKKEVEQLAQK